MCDCIIIGTGVAGISAALTLKALKRSFILLGNKGLSHKIRSAEVISNYPALTKVTGEELFTALTVQLKTEGIEITEGRANGVYPTDGGYSVTCGDEVYEGRTVILATGVETFKPVKGELEFLGRGVSYCAVCDGGLYRGKTVAVFLESQEDLHEAELLAKYADRVHLFVNKGGEEVASAVAGLPNVTGEEGRITEILGDMRVRAVKCVDRQLPVDGVFMVKQAVSASSLVYGLKTEEGAVCVDRSLRTNLDGVFASGDCTGRPFQYAKAAGEGNMCAYSVNGYLNGK